MSAFMPDGETNESSALVSTRRVVSAPHCPDPVPLSRQSGSIAESLADFLHARTLEITDEWLVAVRKDSEILSCESVTLRCLRDHVPQLFLCLTDVLRNAFDSDIKERAADGAASHGQQRWEEGYNLTELLREIGHLRSVVIRHLVEFDEMNPEFGGAARLFALITVHRFIDDVMRESVEQFVGAASSS